MPANFAEFMGPQAEYKCLLVETLATFFDQPSRSGLSLGRIGLSPARDNMFANVDDLQMVGPSP